MRAASLGSAPLRASALTFAAPSLTTGLTGGPSAALAAAPGAGLPAPAAAPAPSAAAAPLDAPNAVPADGTTDGQPSANASLLAAAENPIAAHVFDASRPFSPAGLAMAMLDGLPYVGRATPERAPRILGRLSPHMNLENFATGIAEHRTADVSSEWEAAKAYIDRYGAAISPKTVIRLAKRFSRAYRDVGNRLLFRYAEQNYRRLSQADLDAIRGAIDFDAFVMFAPSTIEPGAHGVYLMGHFDNLARRKAGRPLTRYPSLYP